MIRRGKDIPLALMAAKAVDSIQHPSLSECMVRVRFESSDDAYALSEWLWVNVHTERRCSHCRKYFEYNEHFQHVFSIALNAENKVQFLHRTCADNNRALRVVVEGTNWSDVMHELNVSWRGMRERAVIGSTAALKWDGTALKLLRAQRDAQDRAEERELEAELERRRAWRAEWAASSTAVGRRPLTLNELKEWLSKHAAGEDQYLRLLPGRASLIPREVALTIKDKAQIIAPSAVPAFLAAHQWRDGGHGLEVIQ